MSDRLIILVRSFGEGLLARAMNDEAKAHAAFTKVRAEQEKIVQAQPDYGPVLCMLGLIDAALGNKEAALAEGRRAIELLPDAVLRDHRGLDRREGFSHRTDRRNRARPQRT